MGLFGFFATLFGLGAVAKDGLSDMIDDTKKRHKAKIEDRPWYTVNGYKTRSTRTGMDVYKTTDYFNTGHELLIDKKSGNKIEDLTMFNRKNLTENNKRKAFLKGVKFYRTTMFDMNGSNKSEVYINDDMPGRWFAHSFENKPWMGDTYYEGELISIPSKSNPDKKEVCIDYCKSNRYFADGTLVTNESIIERFNTYNKKKAIENGDKYYKCMKDPRNSYMVYYRCVKTDDPVYYDYENEYFTAGNLVKEEIQIKLHHKETMVVYNVEEIIGFPRYNLDGSNWVK